MRIFAIVILILLSACSSKKEEKRVLEETKLVLKHAKNFNIYYGDGGVKRVEVIKPWKDADISYEYVLVPKGAEIPKGFTESDIIRIPVERIACVATTHVGLIDRLGIEEQLVAIADGKYVYDSSIAKKIADGRIIEIGMEADIDIEKLILVEPDLVLNMGIDNSAIQKASRYEDLGLKIVFDAEFMELSPLGQAEWIKFLAAFTNQEELAEILYDEVLESYEELRAKVGDANRPTVFTGFPYKGQWTVPGGKSFPAQFIEDAGAEYLWSDDKSRGSIFLDFEGVAVRASEASFWINPGVKTSKREIESEDERYGIFKPMQNENRIWNNNKRLNEYGGNDFWESGIVYPNRILSDLIKIFHPEIENENEFYYYQVVN